MQAMQALYDIPAPAKLNLFLHITGRRADGYHLLQSAFMLIDWCDQLHFELRTDGGISREDLTWTLPEDDLCLRAAKALQSASGCKLGVHIGIAKSVPAQAGMGGGSSDADALPPKLVPSHRAPQWNSSCAHVCNSVGRARAVDSRRPAGALTGGSRPSATRSAVASVEVSGHVPRRAMKGSTTGAMQCAEARRREPGSGWSPPSSMPRATASAG